jgi:Xaa-Pro aminopeptidase
VALGCNPTNGLRPAPPRAYTRAHMRTRPVVAGIWLVVLCLSPSAQPVFGGAEIFPAEEFGARRAKVAERIGSGVAILLGTAERPGEQPFRQNNQFFYLTGVAQPRAIVAIDGRSKRTTLFLPPYDERREQRMFGPALHPGSDAARATGIDGVLARDQFDSFVGELASEGRIVYTPFRPEVLGEASSSDAVALARATRQDPWDGRASREETFIARLKAAAPRSEIRDLDPIVDALRVVKSPREIAVIREATRIAGLAIVEAMRDAAPGRFEYELQADAEFVFKQHGAYGPSYFALIATGPNTWYSHYNKNTAPLQDGDLVQFDYAPDYKYYQSDVTRVFPANGVFTARQRELYSIYLELYRALMTSIEVHQPPRAIIATAVAKMDRVMERFRFTDARIKAAATAFVERYRTSTAASLGHAVGMEVHDVGGPPPTLEPGQVFTIEPAMQIPEEHIGIRLEDMILITASGYENLSAGVPIEIDAIEREMKRPGLQNRHGAAPGTAAVEQATPGTKPPPEIVVRFDGLGGGFSGPQGTAPFRNPSDNSLAVGPGHVVQTVNSRLAVFDKSGKVLYGPVPTNTVFHGFGGACEVRNNGDAVVRYDQLANRWLIVMPVFSRGPARADQPPQWRGGAAAYLSPPARPDQPGPAVQLPQSVPPQPSRPAPPVADGQGPYSICYAVSSGPDPLGAYYRYEFLRPLFPDYPRPAIWPDGYYVATSTGDDRISDAVATQKHACVVDRAKMLKGEPATEQCIVVENVNFLNNADVDGTALPPNGAPNVMVAAGGTQLDGIFEAAIIDVWQFHVDWRQPANTRISGPDRIPVAPYHYLCDGQLSNCVPQPGSERRLDSQGDKIMPRLVYRRIRDQESVVAVHSVNTSTGGGGVRWYELRIDRDRSVRLHQQGTFAADGYFRWLPSPAIDRAGNIAIGYSFAGGPQFAGQRVAARFAGDPPGVLTTREATLVEGEAAQSVMRWEDYTQTAIDPSDDCTIWYVGDYVRKGSDAYSSRIGAFRLSGCGQ